MTRVIFAAAVILWTGVASFQGMAVAVPNDPKIVAALESIRVTHGLPALGGAVVTSRGVAAVGVTGVRKLGADVTATVADLWHLGSDTKAMTAVVIATLVDQRKLTWETTIGEILAVPPSAPESFRQITLLQLLSHRAGLVSNIDWRRAASAPGGPRAQRVAALPAMAATPLSSAPGTKYEYSNLGYVLAGTIAEQAANRAWEDLIRDVVFAPLGMTSCGFGGLGTRGTVDQPWPHDAAGKPMPVNGPDVDNPEVMGPAGTVHCSLADWGKFSADQLAGLSGKDGLLKAATYAQMHAPAFGGDYAAGWLVTSRPWGGGIVYTHNGSNTMNFATAWMAPARDFAVLVVTNRGGAAAQRATDAAASALIVMRAGGGLP